MPPKLTRAQRLEQRNQRIRDAFYQRFTKQARPRIYTREGIVSQLAQEFFLSMGTVENIIYQKAA